MAKFSELFPAALAQHEVLSEIREPRRSIASIAEVSASHAGLRTEDAAALIAWGRDPERRTEIQLAERHVRGRVAGGEIEFIIPVYLTSFCQKDWLYFGYRTGR
jgi:hypothetical protein